MARDSCVLGVSNSKDSPPLQTTPGARCNAWAVVAGMLQLACILRLACVHRRPLASCKEVTKESMHYVVSR